MASQPWLKLLQLADSALPIGALAHSFGLESLVEDGLLSVGNLSKFCRSLLAENLLLESVYCRTIVLAPNPETLLYLNARLSALRPARESREASLMLGKRFLALAAHLEESQALRETVILGDVHFPLAFGYASGLLQLDPEQTVAAFLQQSLTAVLSVSQRLLPLGQMLSGRILWRLKGEIETTVRAGERLSVEEADAFCHLSELASMRHPALGTRLFIS